MKISYIQPNSHAMVACERILATDGDGNVFEIVNACTLLKPRATSLAFSRATLPNPPTFPRTNSLHRYFVDATLSLRATISIVHYGTERPRAVQTVISSAHRVESPISVFILACFAIQAECYQLNRG